MSKIYFTAIIFLIYFQVSFTWAKNQGSMSPPNLSISKFESCRGPKRKDCCDCQIGLIGDSDLRFNLNVKEDVETKGKIVGISNGKEIIRFQMKKPCNNLFMKTLYSTLMNVTGDCVILKGLYKFNINVLELNNKYNLGIYTPALGNITFKSTFYSDKCNFMCSVIDINIASKNK